MTPIHITTLIDSETLHLPELGPLVGKTVEITITEKAANGDAPPEMTPSVDTSFFMALKPEVTPLTNEEIAILKEDPNFEALRPLLDVAGEDLIDADAIARWRAASMP
jgi:hypothetical protein